MALRGSRQDGSPGVVRGSRAGAGIRPPDDAGRLSEVRERAAELAVEPWHSDSAAKRELRRYSLLLRDSAPPDQLAQLPRGFQRYGFPQCDPHGFRQEFGEELPEFFLLRLYQVPWGSSKGQLLFSFLLI